MKTLRTVAAMAAGLCLLAATASAKCYRFSDGDAIRVCVKGDAFSDRKKAKNICDKVKGGDCGTIVAYSGSCFSNAGKCYDSKGKAHRSLSGF